MRLIQSGVTPWGPEQFTCTQCKDRWEVEKTDLSFWYITDGPQWDPYEKLVVGFVCPSCGKSNRIRSLDDKATHLKVERDYKTKDAQARAGRIL